MARNYGSAREFKQYRENFSYPLPSPRSAIDNAYLVLKNGAYGKYFTTTKNYIQVLEKERKLLGHILEDLISHEETKEDTYLIAYMASLPKEEQKFTAYLETLPTTNEKFEAIQLRKDNLLDLQKSLQENIIRYSTNYGKMQNRHFLESFYAAAFKLINGGKGGYSVSNINNNFDVTFDQIFEEMAEQLHQRLKIEMQPEFLRFMDSTFEAFKKNVMQALSMKQGTGATTLNQYFDLLKPDTKDDIFTAKDRGSKQRVGKEIKRKKTVRQTMETIAATLLMNGLSEESIHTRDHGIHMGNVTTNYGNMVDESLIRGAIQTDSLELYKEDLTIDYEAEQQILNMLKEAGYKMNEQIEKALQVYSEKGFVLSYSMKDLFQFSTQRRATVRGKASFAQRLQTFREIGDGLGVGATNQLIFDIVNMANGGINSDSNSRALMRDSLTAVCMAWMFEDYKDTFVNLKSNLGNRLHIFMINGHYYLMSTVLRLIKAQVDHEAQQLHTIHLTFTFSGANKDDPKNPEFHNTPYGKMATTSPRISGIARWDETRKNALLDDELTISINTRTLERIVYELNFDAIKNLYY